MRKQKKKWKFEQLIMFSNQLSNLLSSGIPLIAGLQFLVEQKVISTSVGRNIINQLQKGRNFSESLQEENFPNLFISFIRSSEEHGDYVFGLTQCENYFRSREKWQREVKQACMYPLFVLILVIVALFFMIGMVLPRFQELYATMGVDLPFITRFMLSVFKTLSSIMWSILIFGGAMLIYLSILRWNKKEKDRWMKWLLYIPFIRNFFRYYFTHYISIQLGTLLQSGVPLLTSVKVIEKYTPWPILGQYLANIKNKLLKGHSFLESIEGCLHLFLPTFFMMIALGEKSGRLDQALLHLATGTEQALKMKMDRFIQSLEPFLIFFIGCFIALTVITMFLPMLQLVRAL